MTDPPEPKQFAASLVQRDETLHSPQYQEYRMQLELALETATRRERLVRNVAIVSCVISMVLVYVGGSEALGSFDPWEKNATILSVTLGGVYWLSTIVFFLSVASYYSRFRPAIRTAREELRDASILELQREVSALRKLIEGKAGHGNAT